MSSESPLRRIADVANGYADPPDGVERLQYVHDIAIDALTLGCESAPEVGVVWTRAGDVEITITAPDGRSFTAGLDPDDADGVARVLAHAAAAASRIRRGVDPVDGGAL